MSTPQEQIEQVARECAIRIANPKGSQSVVVPFPSDVTLILTAASRIAAIKVRESGAVECLEELGNVGNGGSVWVQRIKDDGEESLTALRAIISEGTK
jgi:hypothetical protein